MGICDTLISLMAGPQQRTASQPLKVFFSKFLNYYDVGVLLVFVFLNNNFSALCSHLDFILILAFRFQGDGQRMKIDNFSFV